MICFADAATNSRKSHGVFPFRCTWYNGTASQAAAHWFFPRQIILAIYGLQRYQNISLFSISLFISPARFNEFLLFSIKNKFHRELMLIAGFFSANYCGYPKLSIRRNTLGSRLIWIFHCATPLLLCFIAIKKRLICGYEFYRIAGKIDILLW